MQLWAEMEAMRFASYKMCEFSLLVEDATARGAIFLLIYKSIIKSTTTYHIMMRYYVMKRDIHRTRAILSQLPL